MAADTAQITRDVQKVNGTLDSISTSAGIVGKALLSAFTLTAVVTAGKQVLDFADSVTNLSQRLGISTDAVQKFSLAFDPVGVSIDQVGVAIGFLANAVIGGEKSAVAVLQKLGLSAKALAQLSMEEMFLTVGDAIGNMGNKAEQIYASKTLLGKGGVELLAGLTGHLRETTDAFDDMGLIIDSKTIKAADDFGDQLGLMGKQLLGVVAAIVGPLLPALSAFGTLVSWLANIVKTVFVVAIKTVQTVIGFFLEGLAHILAKVAEMITKIPIVGKHLEVMGKVSAMLTGYAEGTSEALKHLWGNADEVGDKTKKATPPTLGLGKAADDAATAAVKAAKELRDFHNELGVQYKKDVEAAEKATADAATALRAFHNELGVREKENIKEAAEATAKLAAEMRALNNDLAVLDMEARAHEFAFVGPTLDMIDIKTKAWRETLASLPDLLIKAFTGGGGVGGAIKAFGVKLADDLLGPLMKKAGGAIGGALSMGATAGSIAATVALGAATMGISVAAGLAYAGLKKLFGGVSQEVKDARAKVGEFEASLRAALTPVQALEAGNVAWKATVIAVRDAYLATGRSAAEAEAAVAHLWSSAEEGAAATEAAMAPILEAFEEQRRAAETLTETLGRYNFSIEELGPAMQRQKLSEQAQQLYKDWEVLIGAGIEMGAVGREMAASINKFVQAAIRTKTEVDPAMRPMLEHMARMGLLTDEAGNKITNLEDSGITFAMSMSEGFKAIVAEVKKLTDTIRIGLGLALDTTRKKITDMPDVRVRVRYEDPGPPRHDGGPSDDRSADRGFAHGTGGRFLDFGRGTRVTLHGRERIMTEGERSGDVHVHVAGSVIASQDLADTISEALDRRHQGRHKVRAA